MIDFFLVYKAEIGSAILALLLAFLVTEPIKRSVRKLAPDNNTFPRIVSSCLAGTVILYREGDFLFSVVIALLTPTLYKIWKIWMKRWN